MLILSRRPGDAIVIDGGIRIVVLASDKRGVRIGIEAPPHVSIVREEIVAQIVDENRRANAGPEAAALVGGLAPLAAQRPKLPAPSAPATSQASQNGARIASFTGADSSES
jgi:carbon storage regulator